MQFLEMDQSAKPGEKWRRRTWTTTPLDGLEVYAAVDYISPNPERSGFTARGWIAYLITTEKVKKYFSNEELCADDWEKFE